MKYTIKIGGRFKKNYKLAQKRGLDISLLKDIIFKLSNGIPLDKRNKDHALKGKWQGFRECHIQPDWLLIYLAALITINICPQKLPAFCDNQQKQHQHIAQQHPQKSKGMVISQL